jgi:uncharacterized oxidoreductase
MQLNGNTILITGGGSGIGLAMAKRFLSAENDVTIVGRRADKLKEAKQKHPALRTRIADVSTDAGRLALAEWAARETPHLNVLVNNAGIQQRLTVHDAGNWPGFKDELAVNLEAPVHLTLLLLPQLRRQPRSTIINVTSGLAFVPMALAPVYSATKAALRSFTQSLRHQLKDTAVEVIEVIPPAVQTDLGGPGLHTFGTPLEEFADGVFAGLKAGRTEITHGFSEKALAGTPAERDALFKFINR